MVDTNVRPGGSTISKQNQKAIRCYASAVCQLLTSLALANTLRRIPDVATLLTNYESQCESTITLSDDDGEDGGSRCKSTQSIIILSDNDDDDVKVITTHQSSYKPPCSTDPTTVCVQHSRLSFHLAKHQIT